MKVPLFIYTDTKSLLEKINTCHNDLEESSPVKVNKQTACSYSLFTKCSFDSNRHHYYRGNDCMKNFSNMAWKTKYVTTNRRGEQIS